MADPLPNGYTAEQRELILCAYQERSSLRGLTCNFSVSRNTVTIWSLVCSKKHWLGSGVTGMRNTVGRRLRLGRPQREELPLFVRASAGTVA